jgi:hypothetical protein
MLPGGENGHRRSIRDMTLVLHHSVVINSKGDIIDYLGWFPLMSTIEESPVENYGIPKSMDKGLQFD